MNKFKYAFAAMSALALVVPTVAGAHVTVQPKEVPAGGFTRLDVRVPNESDSAATDRVEVQFPAGFEHASYEPVPGWEVKVATKDDQVSTITWTATDPSAAIEPGQFRDFGLSVGIPEDYPAGESLTFPSIQRYDDGETVRWIGEPDSDRPAPQILLTEPTGDHGADTAHEEPEEAEPAAAVSETEDDGGNGLAIAALIVGGLGLATGGASLARGRRSA